MTFKTADLCDDHEGKISVAEPLFADFGGNICFSGKIFTIKCFEDNSLVRESLSENGKGRVLVVDGGGSLRCALLGDQLAELALNNGWVGILVNGCIRDSAQIAEMKIGVMALATHPRKSIKLGHGQTQVPVSFAGVTFSPDQYVYCDTDGLVLANESLVLKD